MWGKNGYIGNRMSERAQEAYDNGEKPLSKWTKSEIIYAIKNERESGFDSTILEKLTSEELRDFLVKTSWHHTGSFFNRTDFYSLDEDEIQKIDKNYVDEIIKKRLLRPKRIRKPKEIKPNNYVTAFVTYTCWEGTRKHPKKVEYNEVVQYRENDKMVKTNDGNKRISNIEIHDKIVQKTKYASKEKMEKLVRKKYSSKSKKLR